MTDTIIDTVTDTIIDTTIDKPCIICLETDETIAINDLKPVTTLIKMCACKFYTHEKCIVTWITNNPTCPYCKELLCFECCMVSNEIVSNEIAPNEIILNRVSHTNRVLFSNTTEYDNNSGICISKCVLICIIVIIMIIVIDKIFLL